MNDRLNELEISQVGEMKKRGILLPYKKECVEGLTKNGGCGVFCGDGDIDAPGYHKETVASRNHSVEVFGGPLVFAPSFRGKDTGLAEGLLRNIMMGMSAKRTRAIFLYPHWPCAAGALFDYSMVDVINLMPEVAQVFKRISDNIHLFFHIKKRFDEELFEQNTYKLILPKERIVF